jgi:hypothetical protein
MKMLIIWILHPPLPSTPSFQIFASAPATQISSIYVIRHAINNTPKVLPASFTEAHQSGRLLVSAAFSSKTDFVETLDRKRRQKYEVIGTF